MQSVLYLIAFVLLGSSATIGHKIDFGPIGYGPLRPALVQTFTGIAGLAGVAAFIWGFFALSWWIPLIAIPISAIAGGLISFLAWRSAWGPLYAILFSLGGLLTAGAVLSL